MSEKTSHFLGRSPARDDRTRGLPPGRVLLAEHARLIEPLARLATKVRRPLTQKIYMGDVGLLTLKSGMASQVILSENEPDNGFMGGLTEYYVAQALATNGHRLFYWKNKNTAEVDFVLQIQDKIIPVVVKKGRHTKSTSLTMFRKQFNCENAIRISKKNFGNTDGILSIPCYAVFCI